MVLFFAFWLYVSGLTSFFTIYSTILSIQNFNFCLFLLRYFPRDVGAMYSGGPSQCPSSSPVTVKYSFLPPIVSDSFDDTATSLKTNLLFVQHCITSRQVVKLLVVKHGSHCFGLTNFADFSSILFNFSVCLPIFPGFP